ncbi:MAG: hypothetical protein Q7R79_04120 [bacterium]|nr:hypothetical protein [bacterium]
MIRVKTLAMLSFLIFFTATGCFAGKTVLRWDGTYDMGVVEMRENYAYIPLVLMGDEDQNRFLIDGALKAFRRANPQFEVTHFTVVVVPNDGKFPTEVKGIRIFFKQPLQPTQSLNEEKKTPRDTQKP